LIFSLLAAVGFASAAEQTWTVNFKDSDIQEVIKFVSDVTGKTTVVDQRVKGRVKVISAKPLNEKELMHLFRTILEINDFTMVDVDNVIRIVPLKDARSSPVPVTDPVTEEDGFVTQVIQLQNIAAAKVLPVIRPLVPQNSHLAAYDPSNSIVISDSVANIDRLRELIERIDKSATPITDVVELKYATADDMVQTLTKIDKDEKARSGSQNTVTLIADKRNNAVLITGEDLQRQRIKILLAKLDKPKPQTGNVRVVYLEYAKAVPTAEILTRVIANLSKLGPVGAPGAAAEGSPSAGATVEADEETNALLITAEGDTLNTMLDVVSRLDIRRAQVMIEAIIVEISEGSNLDLGVSWLFRNTDNGTYGASQAADNVSFANAAFQGAIAADDTDPDNDAADLSAIQALASALGTASGQVLGVVGTNEDVDFSVVLQALQADSNNNILSTPTLLTLDNSEATFTVGQNVPFVTGSFSNTGTGVNSPFQTIQREDVGITLTVTPQVNEGDKVVLDIVQEISSISPSAQASDLITNQRRIETKVLASNGEMIVMGGFIREELSVGENRVPVLGSIPVLGRLFRSDNKSKTKTNLMIFLRATVIRDDAALTGATAEKYHYIRQEQIKIRSRGFLRAKDNDHPLLPDLSHYDLSVPVETPVTDGQ
jgi:general secretion pathway protein D